MISFNKYERKKILTFSSPRVITTYTIMSTVIIINRNSQKMYKKENKGKIIKGRKCVGVEAYKIIIHKSKLTLIHTMKCKKPKRMNKNIFFHLLSFYCLHKNYSLANFHALFSQIVSFVSSFFTVRRQCVMR